MLHRRRSAFDLTSGYSALGPASESRNASMDRDSLPGHGDCVVDRGPMFPSPERIRSSARPIAEDPPTSGLKVQRVTRCDGGRRLESRDQLGAPVDSDSLSRILLVRGPGSAAPWTHWLKAGSIGPSIRRHTQPHHTARSGQAGGRASPLTRPRERRTAVGTIRVGGGSIDMCAQ